MTEVTTYKCDYCGEIFEFEDDCLKHEREHVANELCNRVIMLDSHGELISGFDGNAIEKSYYIYIADVYAFNTLSDLFDEYGYISPRENYGQPKVYPVSYAYNDVNEEWDDIQQKIEEANHLETIHGEMMDAWYSRVYGDDEMK